MFHSSIHSSRLWVERGRPRPWEICLLFHSVNRKVSEWCKDCSLLQAQRCSGGSEKTQNTLSLGAKIKQELLKLYLLGRWKYPVASLSRSLPSHMPSSHITKTGDVAIVRFTVSSEEGEELRCSGISCDEAKKIDSFNWLDQWMRARVTQQVAPWTHSTLGKRMSRVSLKIKRTRLSVVPVPVKNLILTEWCHWNCEQEKSYWKVALSLYIDSQVNDYIISDTCWALTQVNDWIIMQAYEIEVFSVPQP